MTIMMFWLLNMMAIVMGSIEVGKYADFVVLGEDILTVPAERIIDIPIDMTIVGGKIVHRREASL